MSILAKFAPLKEAYDQLRAQGADPFSLNEDGLSPWNAPGYAFYLPGVQAGEVSHLDTSTASYEQYLEARLTPTQF